MLETQLGKMEKDNAVAFSECDFRVTWNLTPQQIREIGQIRAQVFCRELGWVVTNGSTEEWDEFDLGSTHIAALDRGNAVIGALRVTMVDRPWMLDTVFRSLVKAEEPEKERSYAEASRLFVVKGFRSRRLSTGRRICDLLYKAAYGYCQLQSLRGLYMVVSDTVLRHLVRTGLPCRALASPQLMPDGVSAIAVKLDWRMLRENPTLAAWYDAGWLLPLSHSNLTLPYNSLASRAD